jgi:hypothetical protein
MAGTSPAMTASATFEMCACGSRKGEGFAHTSVHPIALRVATPSLSTAMPGARDNHRELD